MTLEPCQACEEISVSERVEPFVVERSGRKVTFEDRRMVCAACGNVSYRGSQISQHELAHAAAVRELEGLLSAEELCAIRLKYKLRQTDMELILSTGPKTWTRWERGKVPQSKVADRFIRALASDPYLARRQMLAAGIKNPEAEEVFAQIERDDRRRAHATLREKLSHRPDVDRDGIAALAADVAFDAVHRAEPEAAAA
ncbi:type II TA system antitoxin MqsA family protein [Methylobacterium sp. 1030]|uniref:type II TA system antitoxin MqsA family protein n=1 Tax=Methylobacterium sp. 1030 TaxID=3156404 RepID=UPI003395192A